MPFSLPIMFPFSTPSVNTRSWELGNSEGQECCYIWHRQDWKSGQLPPRLNTNTHVRTHTYTHARTQAHKDSAATEPPCIHSGTKGALVRTCHSSPGMWLKWAGYRTLSSRRWGGFCHSRAVFWKERREHEKFIRNKQLVSACARAHVFLSLTWLPVQHWAGQLDYHWWHSVKPGSNVSGA